MNWWRIEDEGREEIGLGDEGFNYAVSRRVNVVAVTVVERASDKIVWYGVWDPEKRDFVPGKKDV